MSSTFATLAATDSPELLKTLLSHETELELPRFTNADALDLGLVLLNLKTSLFSSSPKPITIHIERSTQILFHFAQDGTTLDNENWIRRKANTVLKTNHSSFFIGKNLWINKKLTTMEEGYFVDNKDFACHGGGFPINVKGVGLIGVVVVSGLAQAQDHELVVEGLRELKRRIEQQMVVEAATSH